MVLCVSHVSVCVGGPGRRVLWAVWPADLTQGMPTVQGDCRVWGRQRCGQGEGMERCRGAPGWDGVAASASRVSPFTLCHSQLRATPLSVGVLGCRSAPPYANWGGEGAAISVSGSLVHCSFWNGWGLAAWCRQGPPSSSSRGAQGLPLL